MLAIDTYGASTQIFNAGRITGYVDLTDNLDTFLNQAGGVFEIKLTSDFGGGGDLFRNEAGGTVLAASNRNASETSAFVNLERFENSGLILMVDGRVGDVFEISNTVGQEDLVIAASGNSTLAVDAFLGGPQSVSDEFIVNGKITGKTVLAVNNANPGFGAAGAIIPVIFANAEVKPDAFFMTQPIDTGFFDYDLFFRERAAASSSCAHLLAAAHCCCRSSRPPHRTSGTKAHRPGSVVPPISGCCWRAAPHPWLTIRTPNMPTAPLRPHLLHAGGVGQRLRRLARPRRAEDGLGLWPEHNYNLSRDLDVLDWQMGLDLGKRDFLSQGDILVFGVLGGFVGAGLDYDQLARQFDFSGGQVGGYATYLRGGLFVDTLLNAHLLEMQTASLGFPSALDAPLGLRTDTGYRFGSFSGGAFIEPLETIAVLWSDIDGSSPIAAIASPSTTRPMSGDVWACAPAPHTRSGAPPPWSRS